MLVVLLVLVPLLLMVLMVLVPTVRCELGLSRPPPPGFCAFFFPAPGTAPSNRVRQVSRGPGRKLGAN